MEEIEALVILNNIPNMTHLRKWSLLHYFGSARSILNAKNHPTIPDKVAYNLCNWEHNNDWRQDLELIERYGVQLIAHNDTNYPHLLRDLRDYPPLLYVLGDTSILNDNAVAIVGTRQPKDSSKKLTFSLSQELVKHNMLIVSGLAHGVDTAAHQGALINGKTIAVLGSGLGNIYPSENKLLAQSISSKGCIISELPMTTAPERYFFPYRNRIIAALSRGILLIEAPIKSGALIAMEFGYKQNRLLMAIPKNGDGNENMINLRWAKPVKTVNDIIDMLKKEFTEPFFSNDLFA